MMVAMAKDATPEQIARVVDKIREFDLKPVDLPGGDRTAIGVASSIPADLRETLTQSLEIMPGVDHVTQISKSYKLASREFHPADTVVKVGDIAIGSGTVVMMAGPCTIESEEQMMAGARAVKEAGARILRGGAFKPRTSPYAFQGLGLEGLKYLRRAGQEYGMATITEVMDHHDVDMVAEYVDVLQIGARNMQNYPLLTAVGRTNHPVLLKRGPSATIDEWLQASECILQGNPNVMLCERGVHPLDRTYTRYTLDLSAAPVARSISHLPVIVDPSHACGNWHLVASMSLAAVAAGADGLIVEVHPEPSKALCDGAQSLRPDRFSKLMEDLARVASAVGRGF
jgi:3-deoxy-7-phosphoheptulonate synthase